MGDSSSTRKGKRRGSKKKRKHIQQEHDVTITSVSSADKKQESLKRVKNRRNFAEKRLLDELQRQDQHVPSTSRQNNQVEKKDRNLNAVANRNNNSDELSITAASASSELSSTTALSLVRNNINGDDDDKPDGTQQTQILQKMTEACRTILTCIGEDPTRDGLLRTPSRWAQSLLFMTRGYNQCIPSITNNAIFEEDHNEMVVVRDIDIHSLCEHHMVPFTGKVHVGYIPNGRVIGLSKIARIADVYARRLQVQERLTREIADAIVQAVQPMGVAVVVECKHYCMIMRGVEKCGASTVTSSVRGCFERNSKTRAEFFSIINNHSHRLC